MALPPSSPFRGVAAAISQPANEEDVKNQLSQLSNSLSTYNPSIQYRDPIDDQDVREAVYRWDTRSYREIFGAGFTPCPQSSDQIAEDYYNLEMFVNSGGTPADGSRANPSVFVSTTRSTSWRPLVNSSGTIFRYEIFAPGGVDAVISLGDHNQYPNQAEISFAGGINRQYIRTARGYAVTVTPGSQFPTFTPLTNRIYRNGRFNPNPTSSGDTTQEFLNRLRNPTCPHSGEYMINLVYASAQARNLTGESVRNPRSTSLAKEGDVRVEEVYVDPICGVGHFIESAFNSTEGEEAYLFIANKYLHINYAPGTTKDYIIKGPDSILNAFPYFDNTIFAEGIDACFTSSRSNEAYIFRSNIYALINFADGYIIQGPKKITDSFYSLKNTIFADGIDAAFVSSTENEAYIFKGNQYALINFAPGTTDDYIIQGPKNITESFFSLKGTIFEDGMDAAFSSSRKNEAYIFKGDTYALINYAPGSTDDYIIQGPKKITESFSSLKGIIPLYPCGC